MRAFERCYQGQQGAHFLRTQHDGQILAVPGRMSFEDRPRALQRALGDLLLIEQGEEVLPELLFANVIGSPSVVLSQVFDGFEIALLGPGGQAPEL